MIIAQVALKGSMETISRNGFRMLANYIFGNNTGDNGRSQKISMTAPVVVTKNTNEWLLYFVMPTIYTLANLPRPNDPTIKIQQQDSQVIAVLKFSGWVNEKKFNEKIIELNHWISEQGLKAKGEAILDRYNPPWTLPI